MNIILVLSLKGSCMMAGYYILCLLMGKAFSHRMRYLWWKLSMVGFLLPLRWLRDLYVYFFQMKWDIQLVEVSPYDNFDCRKMLFQYHNEVIGLSQGLQKELLFAIIWFAIALAILTFCLIRFYRFYGRLRRSGETVCGGFVLEQLAQAKKDYGICRTIKLFLVEEDRNFSSGLPVPFIVMKKEDKLPEYVLKHELMHVKRRDSLFRIFCLWRSAFIGSIHLFIC